MDVESTMLSLGTKLPEFNLKGIDGKFYQHSDFSEHNGLLVMFICNHCPFVKHINKELVKFTNYELEEMINDYAERLKNIT